ncbi:hypothetical protein TrCOL_g11870 [Triparma columacea]|uniref:Lysosomal Pro-X carboxypeptidase n=1 Tax=Triparma columacea TaxID=722753 RepID=A0A9W7L6I7_9STRA|nr:hypothetical protein TrCOL_g11870 [Triparma columacea]
MDLPSSSFKRNQLNNKGPAWDVYPPDISGTFKVKLNPFSYLVNEPTFNLRYYGYTKFANPTSKNPTPTFVYCGNEGPIESFYNASGGIFNLAETHSALVVFIEHRYYGDSLPFGDVRSFTNGNLRYLNIPSALADYASFLSTLPTLLPNFQPSPKTTILFGGSYGGMLAAWHRFQYPHLSIGAVASGAPIDFYPKDGSQDAFYEAFLETYETTEQGCGYELDRLITALRDVSTYTDLLDGGLIPCSHGPLDYDTAPFWSYALGALATMACVDYPYPTGFIAELPGEPVKMACRGILREGEGGVKKIVEAVNVYVNYTGGLECWDLDAELVGGGRKGGGYVKKGDLGVTSWNYQACTELVLEPLTSDGLGFYPPRDGEETKKVEERCREMFGVTTDEGVMGIRYGRGEDYTKYLTNTILVENSRDPWKVGTRGVGENWENGMSKYEAEGGAHHQDLRFESEGDSEGVKEARRRESEAIGKWLREGEGNKGAIN